VLRVLVAFHAESSSSEKIAESFKKAFEAGGHSVEMLGVRARRKMRVYDYIKEFRKKKRLELAPALNDVKSFDLVVVGTPIRRISGTFTPTPEMITYLRGLKGARNKRFVLFSTCVLTSGSSIKKMSNILTTKGAKIHDTITVKSIFELDEKKLLPVRQLAEKISSGL